MKTKNWIKISALAIAAGLTAAAQSPQLPTPLQVEEQSMTDLRGRAELFNADGRWTPDLPSSSSKLTGSLQGKGLFDTPPAGVPRLPPATVSVDNLRKPVPRKAKKAYGRATRFMQNNEFEKAEFEYKKAISYFPEYAEAHGDLGALYVFTRRDAEAEAQTRRAIELSPRSALTHSNLAWILAAQGKLVDAERSARKALELSPGSPQAHLLLGTLMVSFPETKAEGFRHLEIAAKSLPAASARLKQLGR